jgi:hypothetical protein
MSAEFRLIVVPLDSANVSEAQSTFTVRIVSNLEFPPGTSSPTNIAQVVSAHPLLSRGAAPVIRAFVLEYNAWSSGGSVLNANTPGAIPVSLTWAQSDAPDLLRQTLADYLFRTAEIDVAIINHDRRFDDLDETNFIDIAKMHDDLSVIRTELHERAVNRFGFSRSMSLDSPSLDRSAYAQARWLDTYVQASLLDALFAPARSRTLPVGPEAVSALQSLRIAVERMQRRLSAKSATRSRPQNALKRATSAGETTVSFQDPNVSLHAALKNSALAQACGIVTTWRAQPRDPIAGDYVIVLDLRSVSANSTIAAVTTQPTAFRRKGHTHPLSYADLGKETTNCGLALLNEHGGNARYRSTAINAETASFQATLLQVNNSISNSSISPAISSSKGDPVAPRDDRPPQLLSNDHFGSNELESAGITISAPVEDLKTPPALGDSQRQASLPCLFLEDLWIGFRLDISDGKGGRLLSVHKQRQEITFHGSGKKIQGTLEDFFAREQADPTKDVTSTEIVRYLGLNSAQAADYARFLGTYKEQVFPEPPPFTTRVIDYADATPLRFGRVYPYRLRLVFIGGISFSDRDENLYAFGAGYVQNCPFFRARAFRPGEVVYPKSEPNSPGSQGRPIFLTSDQPRATMWLVPTPIDSDTARYHGTFLVKFNEPARNSHRAFITELAKYFQYHSTKAQYYWDPDVSEILIQVAMLNGDPRLSSREFVYRSGSYCELSEHLRLRTEHVRFGPEGDWEKFRPITIQFIATSSARPEISVSGQRVQITIPPAGDVEVSLIPAIATEKIVATASYAASTMQLGKRQARGMDGAVWAPVPTVAEHKLRAIHCLKRPTVVPVFTSTSIRPAAPIPPVLVAQRDRYKETAELNGYLQIDAASTGQIRLEALWSDIADNPQHNRFVISPARNVSAPRSVSFAKYAPPAPSEIARLSYSEAARTLRQGSHILPDMFELQCSENKVFLGVAALDNLPPQSGRPCILNFGDARRKHAVITAVAISRYQTQFMSGNPAEFEARSSPIFVDVPASVRLPGPEISHVVPLARDIVQKGGANGQSRRVYALRIYIRRSWFLSGPCERVAIGCRSGELPDRPIASLNKYVTQWGEDPVERPKLAVTRRLPRASDFRIPVGAAEPELDDKLYPPNSVEGNSPIIYRDNLIRAEVSSDAADNYLSSASFAVRWDSDAHLWFCDVEVTQEFSGWCGLALYRHQPHAHEGTQLSETPAWVYGAVLRGEQLAWFKHGGKLHVTIGPVYDRYTSFEFDSTEFHDGISSNLQNSASRRVALQKFVANEQTYFEGIVDVGETTWSITKTRFGSDVASLQLHNVA